jgi:chorismate dehydratase
MTGRPIPPNPSLSKPVSEARLRVGRICYTNVAPVETAFDVGAVERQATIRSGAPNVLNAMLSAGELDVSPVSAAHYLANIGQLSLLSDLGIVARSAATSVVLVSRRPPALLAGACIAVTRDSASGLALLQAVLRGRYGVDADYEGVDDPIGAAVGGRPTLLIGDNAIAVGDHVDAGDVHDLGTAWNSWTNLPMAFAVWAVRKDVHAVRPDDIATLAEAYGQARAWGADHSAEVVAAAMSQRPRNRAFYESYFSTLTYTLDERAHDGLNRFAREIANLESPRVAR